ncbi:TIGR01741 family protein, partial [Staphylococcus aureus]|nr:TIGR01741 family protein [Staphylococcus aureus]
DKHRCQKSAFHNADKTEKLTVFFPDPVLRVGKIGIPHQRNAVTPVIRFYKGIPKEYNISVQVFDDLWMDLYDLFEELRDLFKKDLEPWTSCEFDFTKDGKLNVSFDYIDWANSEFGQMGREHYYMYKKFGIWPEKEYAINWVEKIKNYVKEQDEAEL